MCLSIAPVKFGKTITGLYEADDNTHVIFYQNAIGATRLPISRSRRSPVLSLTAPRGGTAKKELPKNWGSGKAGSDAANGNALVIPLMTDNFDSVRLLRETAKTPSLLTDIRTVVQPVSRGVLRKGIPFGTKGTDQVRIEQFDIYTLVTASRASLIPDAVKAVPSNKRPPLNQAIFEKLEEWYDCPFVVACFDNAQAGESKPIAYAFEPRYPGQFLIYTLDGHDGTVPNLDETVTLDHAIFAGSYRSSKGRPVNYRDTIPAALKKYVPTHVVGDAFPVGTKLINGDILVHVDDVIEGNWAPLRVLPPNAPYRQEMTLAAAIAAAE